jgi:hypothetical protein
MLRKQGLGAFSLEIFIIPAEFSPNSYLYLEQYHLLNKKFDLNTQRMVQFRALRPHKIYLYDLEGKILYYSCDSYSKLQKDLGIHYVTFKKCIEQGNNYLNFFKITDTLIEDGKNSVGRKLAGLNLIELNGLIAEKQVLNRINNVEGKRATKSKSIIVKEDITGDTMDFPNILAAVSYLESKNNKVNRNTIAKYLNTGKPFKGYLFNETKDKKVKKVEVYDSNKNFIELCNSLKEASEKYGVSVNSLRLSSYCDKLFKGKYYFKKRPALREEVTNKKVRKFSTFSSQLTSTYGDPFIRELSNNQFSQLPNNRDTRCFCAPRGKVFNISGATKRTIRGSKGIYQREEGKARIISDSRTFSNLPIPPRPITPHPQPIPQPRPNIPTPPNTPWSIRLNIVAGALGVGIIVAGFGIILSFFGSGWWYNDIFVWVWESLACFCGTLQDLHTLSCAVTYKEASLAFLLGKAVKVGNIRLKKRIILLVNYIFEKYIIIQNIIKNNIKDLIIIYTILFIIVIVPCLCLADQFILIIIISFILILWLSILHKNPDKLISSLAIWLTNLLFILIAAILVFLLPIILLWIFNPEVFWVCLDKFLKFRSYISIFIVFIFGLQFFHILLTSPRDKEKWLNWSINVSIWVFFGANMSTFLMFISKLHLAPLGVGRQQPNFITAAEGTLKEELAQPEVENPLPRKRGAQARELKSFLFIEFLFGKHCFKQYKANYITYNKRLTFTRSGFKSVDSKVANYSMFDSYAYIFNKFSLMRSIKSDGNMPSNIEKSPILIRVWIAKKFKGVDINFSKTPSNLSLSVAKARGSTAELSITPIRYGPLTLFNYIWPDGNNILNKNIKFFINVPNKMVNIGLFENFYRYGVLNDSFPRNPQDIDIGGIPLQEWFSAIDYLLDKVPIPGIFYPVTLFNFMSGKNILFYKGIGISLFKTIPYNFYKNSYIINIFDPIRIYRPVTLFNYLWGNQDILSYKGISSYYFKTIPSNFYSKYKTEFNHIIYDEFIKQIPKTRRQLDYLKNKFNGEYMKYITKDGKNYSWDALNNSIENYNQKVYEINKKTNLGKTEIINMINGTLTPHINSFRITSLWFNNGYGGVRNNIGQDLADCIVYLNVQRNAYNWLKYGDLSDYDDYVHWHKRNLNYTLEYDLNKIMSGHNLTDELKGNFIDNHFNIERFHGELLTDLQDTLFCMDKLYIDITLLNSKYRHFDINYYAQHSAEFLKKELYPLHEEWFKNKIIQKNIAIYNKWHCNRNLERSWTWNYYILGWNRFFWDSEYHSEVVQSYKKLTPESLNILNTLMEGYDISNHPVYEWIWTHPEEFSKLEHKVW